jgi:Protein of unknown function (DUF2510)
VTRPAGWYRDPDGTGALRYWDGESSADHHTPTQKSRLEWMVLIGLGATVVVLVGAIVAAVVLAMRMNGGEPTVTAQTASVPTAAAQKTAIETTAMVDTAPAVVFDVPNGTDVESIELHDKPSSRGVTVGL